MMDFEDAAQRLARDQQKLRGRKTVAVSAKAKREADYRKKQQQSLREERLRKQKQQDFIEQYMTSCDRSLGVKQLTSLSNKNYSAGLQLTPTSIYGDGDKIALPPSILEFLTRSNVIDGDAMTSSPWMFRIGLLNPNYSFPESVILKTFKPNNEDDNSGTMHDELSDDEDDNNQTNRNEAYLDELAHKYIAYTHGTVVEFTQEEGHVGLPAPVAAALLDPKRRISEHANVNIPSMFTTDPSGSAAKDGDFMDNDKDHEYEDEEKTPGHIFWNGFEIPNMPVEITMVKLPKGKGCTLTPSHEAIQNGFYNLQDVKLVLEQSLIRTRATLSVGDIVHTWHRGVKFDLKVSNVLPATFNAVTCINTDIEVELGEVKDSPDNSNDVNLPASSTSSASSALEYVTKSAGQTLGGGRSLASSSPVSTSLQNAQPHNASVSPPVDIELLPEPPQDQKEGICTVQVRSNGVSPGRRRFDVQSAKLRDLFSFASSIVGSDPSRFRLVTRFPRTIYELDNSSTAMKTLAESGIKEGQLLLMVEQRM